MLIHNFGHGVVVHADTVTACIHVGGTHTVTVRVVSVSADSMPQPHITFMGYIFGADATHALYVEWVGDGWAAYSHAVDDDDILYNERIEIKQLDFGRETVLAFYDPRTGTNIGPHGYYCPYSYSIMYWTDDYCAWFLTCLIDGCNYQIDVLFKHGFVRYSGVVDDLPWLPNPTPPVYIFDTFYNNHTISVEFSSETTDIINIYKWRG